MDNIEKKVENVEQDIQYFDKMVAGADHLVKPWKHLAIVLAIAIVLSNAIWAGVHSYAIYKAYENPTTIDIQQNQEQPDQKQEQGAKGGS